MAIGARMPPTLPNAEAAPIPVEGLHQGHLVLVVRPGVKEPLGSLELDVGAGQVLAQPLQSHPVAVLFHLPVLLIYPPRMRDQDERCSGPTDPLSLSSIVFNATTYAWLIARLSHSVCARLGRP